MTEPVWHRALASADLRTGQIVKVRAAGTDVLLARLEDGRPAAAHPACPHQAADLSEGMLYLGGIDCPRHHYVYDLRTGENVYPKNVFPADKAARLCPLPLYPVKEEDGAVWVQVLIAAPCRSK